ncbi:MAG: EF2563 family selenium-dependent molybdenum hydroxylase system protein [Treponema sp.]|jgi:xanthine dehydrogenase accessory factor|nr:EF2563 family selenium-dependent molybdenum hydroxylase system protein [Treponema sp.]
MLVVIKGAGDLASGIAFRLWHAGFNIAMTEIAGPLAVRRTVSFSQAVYEGKTQVEDITAVLAEDEEQMQKAFAKRQIAVFVDPSAQLVKRLKNSGAPPAALVDAIMAKKNTGTAIDDAPIVIGIGPGFTAGIDCHAVIETMRGHTLGRVITNGGALPNTGIPGEVAGFTGERLLRCGADGTFQALVEIGSVVKKGDVAALVKVEQPAALVKAGKLPVALDQSAAADVPVCAGIDGIVRGLLPSGIQVTRGLKAGDIDPRCEASHCFTVSDKALAIGGGALEAVLRFMPIA